MSERLQDDETVDPDLDVDGDVSGSLDDTTDGATDTESSGGRLAGIRSGVGRRLPGVPTPSRPRFSPRRFGVAVGLFAVGIFVGGLVPLVGAVTQYAGLFAAAFLLGLADRAGYLEAAPAGAVAAGASVLLGTLTTGTFVLGVDLLQRYGIAITGVGVSVGLLLAVAGLYFGRDLRNGLTRSV